MTEALCLIDLAPPRLAPPPPPPLPPPQLDTKWAKDPGFVRYDFAEPECLPEDAKGAFDMVVVDPPFITREVKVTLHLDGGASSPTFWVVDVRR